MNCVQEQLNSVKRDNKKLIDENIIKKTRTETVTIRNVNYVCIRYEWLTSG